MTSQAQAFGWIAAGQHLYGYLEPAESPRGVGGFQTLCYTADYLSIDEVDELESRLLYHPSEHAPLKRLFFTLSAGKVIIAQITPVSRTDAAGRGGQYIAHSLVLGDEEITKLDADPFLVFNRFRFIETVEEALRHVKYAADGMNAARIPLSPSPLPTPAKSPEALPFEMVQSFASLGFQAERLSQEGKMIAVVGTPSEVERTLQAVWFTLPIPLRRRCSFDTHFLGCNPVYLRYWAVGLPEHPTSPYYIVYDAKQNQFVSPISVKPDAAYERWLYERLRLRRNEPLARAERERVYQLGEWLDGRSRNAPLTELPRKTIDDVLNLAQDKLRERLYDAILQQCPLPLAERIVKRLWNPTNLLSIAQQIHSGFEPKQLAEELYLAYRDAYFAMPPRRELRSLEGFVQNVNHGRLRSLYACWARKYNALEIELRRLDKSEYTAFIEEAFRFGLIQPLVLLVDEHADEFIRIYLGSVPSNKLFLSPLVRKLIDMGLYSHLESLRKSLRQVSDKELRELKALTEKRSGETEVIQFHKAVCSELERRQRQKPHLRDILRRLLLRRSSRK